VEHTLLCAHEQLCYKVTRQTAKFMHTQLELLEQVHLWLTYNACSLISAQLAYVAYCTAACTCEFCPVQGPSWPWHSQYVRKPGIPYYSADILCINSGTSLLIEAGADTKPSLHLRLAGPRASVAGPAGHFVVLIGTAASSINSACTGDKKTLMQASMHTFLPELVDSTGSRTGLAIMILVHSVHQSRSDCVTSTSFQGYQEVLRGLQLTKFSAISSRVPEKTLSGHVATLHSVMAS
jgi:hypothetical protein